MVGLVTLSGDIIPALRSAIRKCILFLFQYGRKFNLTLDDEAKDASMTLDSEDKIINEVHELLAHKKIPRWKIREGMNMVNLDELP